MYDPSQHQLSQFRFPMSEKKTPDWARRQDYYKLIPDNPVYRNPHADRHGIMHPFRMIVVGKTGAGKTQLVMDVLRVTNCFDEIYIFSPFGAKDKLWNLVKEQFKRGPTVITTDFHEIPDPTQEMTDEKQKAVIFDDAIGCSPAVNRGIAIYNTGSRKMNVSVFNIYQTYFDVPKITRHNPTYVVLMRSLDGTNMVDLKEIARRYHSNVDQVVEMYERCQKDPDDFFWIDCDGPPDQRFRRGFANVFPNIIVPKAEEQKVVVTRKRKFKNLKDSTVNSTV